MTYYQRYDPRFSSCRPMSFIPPQETADALSRRGPNASPSRSVLVWCDEGITKLRLNQSVYIVHILLYDQTTSPLPLSRLLISLSMTCSGWVANSATESMSSRVFSLIAVLCCSTTSIITSFDNGLGESKGKVLEKIPCRTKTRLTM